MNYNPYSSENNLINMDYFPNNFHLTINKGGDPKLIRALEEFGRLIIHALRARFKHLNSDTQFGRIIGSNSVFEVVEMVRNGTTDAGLMFANPQRMKEVHLSEPFTYISFTLATDLPQVLPKADALIYPFAVPSWLCILLSVLMMAVLFHITNKKSPSFTRVLLNTLDELFNQGSELTSDSTFLLLIWSFFCFVITASYAAVLLSFLTVPRLEKPVATFKELATAIEEGKYCAYSQPGTFLNHMLKTSGKKHLVYIERMMREQDWCLQKKGEPMIGFGVKRAMITIRPLLNCIFGKPPLSTKYISDENEFEFPASLPINKKFCCKKDLDLAIRRIIYSGLYNKLLNEELFKRELEIVRNYSSQRSDESLSLNDLSGAFYILLLGYIISFLVLILEIVREKRRKSMSRSWN